MIIRSKAPLRLGLAGGGTDVNPYCDDYGGIVLNATIDQYVHCTIIENNFNTLEFIALDIDKKEKYDTIQILPYNGILDLHKCIYNTIIKLYNINYPLSFVMYTYSDAPPGSGLGSSSTLVVSIIKCFVEWLSLPLGEYDIANLAYKIERIELALNGGKQDQYAATFGGFNYIEFFANDNVVVNPLRLKNWIIDELEASIILYYTGASRSSAMIIDDQQKNANNSITTEALHSLKQSAIILKNALLKGDIDTFAEIIGSSWNHKKKLSKLITNKSINLIFEAALNAGAISGKVSGAGGGGFIIFVVNPINRIKVLNSLEPFLGKVINFHFSKSGSHSWKIYK